ncbi:MAG: hypothetical protein WEC39_01755 [Patescibacteria group bacterium]
MAKKNRRSKEKLQARREAEILKAQPKTEFSPPLQREEPVAKLASPNKTSGPQIETKYVRKDLLKSMVLTVGALIIIAAAYLLLR